MIWDSYPSTYRQDEVAQLLAAVRAGACAWVAGLSGAGKSNLAGFFVNRVTEGPFKVLVDLNRLTDRSPDGFFYLVRRVLCGSAVSVVADELASLEEEIGRRLSAAPDGLCLVLDRFEVLSPALVESIGANLRALRDVYKYQLTFVITSRLAPDPRSELAELFFGRLIWLGPLSETDARWSAQHYARRNGLDWNDEQLTLLALASGRYASLLRAACEAVANGCPFEVKALQTHPIMLRRVTEFQAASFIRDDIIRSGLGGHALLDQAAESSVSDLTAGEARLLTYLQAHPDQVCEKDDLVKAVWPEDRVYEIGVRDDSLSQLVRRLRLKIEEDPANPLHIQTVVGRGYRFKP